MQSTNLRCPIAVTVMLYFLKNFLNRQTCVCSGLHTLEWFHIFLVDSNECQNVNGGCQQVCINLQGTFGCSCNHGFKLTENQRTCEGTLHTLETYSHPQTFTFLSSDGYQVLTLVYKTHAQFKRVFMRILYQVAALC